MKTRSTKRSLVALMIIFGLFGLGHIVVAATKTNHHDGKKLIGDKIKTDGRHVIDKKGNYTTSADVKKGKIAGVHVKNAKGDVPVKKYKTNKKMAQLVDGNLIYASFHPAQDQDLGTVYIGYAYTDDEGNQEIYWFPYEEVLDGDTGAIEYVPDN
jgi:hypothetical protein